MQKTYLPSLVMSEVLSKLSIQISSSYRKAVHRSNTFRFEWFSESPRFSFYNPHFFSQNFYKYNPLFLFVLWEVSRDLKTSEGTYMFLRKWSPALNWPFLKTRVVSRPCHLKISWPICFDKWLTMFVVTITEDKEASRLFVSNSI